MQRTTRVRTLQVLIVSALALATRLAGAATFTYDFESLNTGSLEGQDGWSTSVPGQAYPVVTAGPGNGNTSRVLQGVSNSPSSIGFRRYLPFPFLFDSANPLGSVTFWARAGGVGANDFVGGGLEINGWILPVAGIYFATGDATPKTFIRVATTGVYTYGSLLVKDHWYEIKLDVDFSVAGGRGSLSYRDVTAGQIVFTADPALQNIALGITPNPEGRYVASSFGFRTGISINGDTFCLDNFSATGPCLPSAYTALSDPFTDGNLINGTDPLDITWTNDSVTAISVANDAVIGQGNALKVNAPDAPWGGVCLGFSPSAAILGNEIGSLIRWNFDVRTDKIISYLGGFRFGLYQCALSANAYFPPPTVANYYDNGYFAIISTGSSNGVNIVAEANTNDILGGSSGVRQLSAIGTDLSPSLSNNTVPHTIQLDMVRTTYGEAGAIRLTLRFDGIVQCIRDDAAPLGRAFNLMMFRGFAPDLDFYH